MTQRTDFYQVLERVLNGFPKYHMKILLGDFNPKQREREDIFKPTIDSENLHESSNDNGVSTVCHVKKN